MLIGYYEQLLVLCRHSDEELRRAFAKAGVPSSTYYRAKHGQDLRFSTAQKIASHIQEYPNCSYESISQGTMRTGETVLQGDDC